MDVAHRTVAFGLLLLCISLLVIAGRAREMRRDLFKGSLAALILVCLQAVSGGILIATKLSIPAFLLHVTNVSALFATLAYLSVQVLPEPKWRSSGSREPRVGVSGSGTPASAHLSGR
ncbi:hypothetical protein [Alicyclobacillus ferrooxydans]|uniref:hypothetical protein n=1 Tax=Alicyclobacillus ferrooxydans TaxID=471514 RepID=UPI0006D580CF|nr:hypothetical protein [Alicyclobacillus ferrooxydans]